MTNWSEILDKQNYKNFEFVLENIAPINTTKNWKLLYIGNNKYLHRILFEEIGRKSLFVIIANKIPFPFKDNLFNIIVVDNLEDISFLSEYHRILKRRGKLIFMEDRICIRK